MRLPRWVLCGAALLAAAARPSTAGAPAYPPIVQAAAKSADTPDRILAFFSSPQYNRLGRTDAQFVSDCYFVILHRLPASREVADLVKAMERFHAGRRSVVKKFLDSPEYRTAHAPKPPPPPDAALSIFQKAGVWVSNASSIDPIALATTMKRNRFGWVAIQVSNACKALNDIELATVSWLKPFRDAGILVGGWSAGGWGSGCDLSGPDEAKLAASRVRDFKLDFYIADCEMNCKQGYPGGWERSAQFAKGFRAILPGLPAAFAPEGAAQPPWLPPIDFPSWRSNGFQDLAPQAYQNYAEFMSPSTCTAQAIQSGYALERVHPIIGIWGGGENRLVSAAEYVEQLRKSKTVGFSVYLADSFPPSDPQWSVLGDAIVRYGIAKY